MAVLNNNLRKHKFLYVKDILQSPLALDIKDKDILLNNAVNGCLDEGYNVVMSFEGMTAISQNFINKTIAVWLKDPSKRRVYTGQVMFIDISPKNGSDMIIDMLL